MLRSRSLRSLAVVLLVAWAGSAAAQPPARRHVRLDFHCEIAKLPDGAKTVDLWIPMPASDERQDVKLLNESDLREGRITQDKSSATGCTTGGLSCPHRAAASKRGPTAVCPSGSN